MSWSDELAAALPTPENEPEACLRDDIVDELADHLSCAANRERLNGTEAARVPVRVIERFGDPRRVARQLWFDAWKGRLMSQRIQLAFMGLVVLVCAGSLYLTWQMNQALQTTTADSRDFATRLLSEQAERTEQLLTQSQATQFKLLEQMQQMSRTTVVPEWNPVSLQLVDSSGKPVVGFEVEFGGKLHSSEEESNLRRQPDAEGRVDFGLVRPGEHYLRVTTPWNELYGEYVHVLPGRPLQETIVCPVAPLEKAQLALSLEWPDALPAADGLMIGVAVFGEPREFDNRLWVRDAIHFVYWAADGEAYVHHTGPGDSNGQAFRQFEFRDPPQKFSVTLDIDATQTRISRPLLLKRMSPTELAILEIEDVDYSMLAGQPAATVQPAADQTVTAEIIVPDTLAANAKACLAYAEFFADGGNRRISSSLWRKGMLAFFAADTDGDGQLSAEEHAANDELLPLEQSDESQPEFPIAASVYLNRLLRTHASTQFGGRGGLPATFRRER